MNPYSELAREAVEREPVRRLLAERSAVVFERIARGAGATRWFLVTKEPDLESLYSRLSPGSVVSFYFDGRIAALPWGDDAYIKILDLIAETGDSVVGRLCADGLELAVQCVAGASEIGEFAEDLQPGVPVEVFIGATPARDNDGLAAVTVTLPDRDGVIRPHPH